MTPAAGSSDGAGSVLVLGLSPAWQQMVELPRLIPGEVNRARAVSWSASGKVLNVARSLATLGHSHRVISPIGGPLRPAIEADLAADGVDVVWVPTQAAMRTCTTLIDASTGTITELVENAPAMSVEERERYASEMRRAVNDCAPAVIDVTGSYPAGTAVEDVPGWLRLRHDWHPEPQPLSLVVRTAGQASSGTHSPVGDQSVADVSSDGRTRLVLDIRGAALRAFLPQRPFVVKPNRTELAETVQRPLVTDGDLLSAMRELNELGAEWVVVTQGAEAVWARSRGELWSVRPPRAPVVNSIGCGDALTAGLAAGLADGWTLPEALRWGVAAAADRVTRLLPGKLDRRLVSEWFSRTAVERVERL